MEFIPYPSDDENAKNLETFEIELSRTMKYKELESILANKLGCDPKYCRFTHST